MCLMFAPGNIFISLSLLDVMFGALLFVVHWQNQLGFCDCERDMHIQYIWRCGLTWLLNGT